MKKLLLSSFTLLSAYAAYAQTDTLLWNNFETDPAGYMQIAIPNGNATDTSWYTFDMDGQPDGSTTNRPGEWFWSTPFSDNDTIGNTGVLASNSWTNSSTPTENILVTPSIYIADTNAVLHWKSCPFQTPRYLDGYQVLVSTVSNDPISFTDTLFVASEYVSLDNSAAPNSFSSYTFAPVPTMDPMNPFVHGMDGTYTDPNATTASDSSRLLGRLRPFTASLAQYSGQTIFIMFHHYSTDDNLLSLDDVLVTGTDVTGIQSTETGIAFSAFPNPANEQLNIRYALPSSSKVAFNVYEITGQLVMSQSEGTLDGQQTQTLDVSHLPAGIYRVEMVTDFGRSNVKIVVQ